MTKNSARARNLRPKKPWSEVTMDEYHVNAAHCLAVRVRRLVNERSADWVAGVADVYRGGKLPSAVANSMEKLEKLSRPIS